MTSGTFLDTKKIRNNMPILYPRLRISHGDCVQVISNAETEFNMRIVSWKKER